MYVVLQVKCQQMVLVQNKCQSEKMLNPNLSSRNQLFRIELLTDKCTDKS